MGRKIFRKCYLYILKVLAIRNTIFRKAFSFSRVLAEEIRRISTEAATEGVLYQRVFLQNSQENTRVRVSLLIKLLASRQLY